MSCLQITAFLPATTVNKVSCSPTSLKGASVSYATRLSCAPLRLPANASVYKLRSPVCLFGGKGKPGDITEPLREGLRKAMDSFKKGPSVEDMLKKQIQKQEYADDGDGGGRPPDSNDGYGGGSGEDDFSEKFEEFIQVMLATLAFIFLYIFIIDGQSVIQILKDMVRFLFGARDSVRLQRIMERLGSFLIAEKEIELPANWLEAAIINTPTWWDGPEKNKFILKHHPRPRRSDY